MDLDTEVGVPRSFATHASLCNALSSNKLCPKTVKILAVKGLKQNTKKKNLKTDDIKFCFVSFNKVPFAVVDKMKTHFQLYHVHGKTYRQYIDR